METSQTDSALGGQFQIQIADGINHSLDRKIFTDKVRTRLAKLLAQHVVAGEQDYFFGQFLQIAGSNQESSFAVETHFASPVTIINTAAVANPVGAYHALQSVPRPIFPNVLMVNTAATVTTEQMGKLVHSALAESIDRQQSLHGV